MSSSNTQFEKHIGQKSSRHHYIPQFLINGFLNENEKLYVYNKETDRIISKPQSKKSIFFETDRNTVELKNGHKSSIIEDLLYFDLDFKSSKIISYYQAEEISKINFTIEDLALFRFFLISLFWRIPASDYAFKNLMDNSEIASEGLDPISLKFDPTFRKFQRAGMVAQHLRKIFDSGIKGQTIYNIHQQSHPVFVLGDFPFLMRNEVEKLSQFNTVDVLMAISSRRIVSCTSNTLENFGLSKSVHYNAAIIHQSIKYVGCADLNVLKRSIDLYKLFREKGIIYSNELVFESSSHY